MTTAASACRLAASLAAGALSARTGGRTVKSARAISVAASRHAVSWENPGLAQPGRCGRRAGGGRTAAYRTMGHGGTSYDEPDAYNSFEAAFVSEECTPWATGPCTDEFYMGLALEEAMHAADANEVPVGAVLVHEGSVVARAHNRVEDLEDPTAHAEMLCIRQGAEALSSWQLLKDCTIYVTLEPCPMCAGALLQARVGTIVYGAPSPLLGADGGWIQMLGEHHGHHGHGEEEHWAGEDGGEMNPEGGVALSSRDEANSARPKGPHPFHPEVVVRRGVMAEQAAKLMRAFFRWRREHQVVGPGVVPAWREYFDEKSNR